MLCDKCGNKITNPDLPCPFCGYMEGKETVKNDNIIEVEVKEETKIENKPAIKTNNYFKDVKLFVIYFLMLIPIAFIIVSYIVFKFNALFFVSLVICAIIEIFAIYLFLNNKNKHN